MMKTIIRFAAGSTLIAGAIGAAQASGPPPSLDRPTPPPCCADGICQPNPLTWGHYSTRWRRWPTDYLDPLPPEAQPPAPLGPDVPGFEPPAAEEEDRRAPPPTPPREAPEGEDRAPAPPGQTPESGTPPTMPAEPPTSPSSLPFSEPSDEPRIPPQPYDAAPPTTLPFGGEPPTPSTLPFGEPMGDADPAPTPPFAAPTRRIAPAAGAAIQRGFQRPQRPIRAAQPDDPPPAIPIAMSSWTN